MKIKEKTKLRKELKKLVVNDDTTLTIYNNGQWRLMEINGDAISSSLKCNGVDEIAYNNTVKGIYCDYDFYDGCKNWINSFFKYSGPF